LFQKPQVVNDITEQLALKNVTSEQARAEEISGKYDFIISRAVTSLPQFSSWVSHLVSSENKNRLANGILYLKGGEFNEEFDLFKSKHKVFLLSEYFSEPFFDSKKVVHLTNFS